MHGFAGNAQPALRLDGLIPAYASYFATLGKKMKNRQRRRSRRRTLRVTLALVDVTELLSSFLWALD